ncbi:MAG: hypothetical protein LBN01_04580 [Endomicrobium sp.]|jgi:hypothetical protein|nr:hypothetical protein [Endomicrobium sp.]
MKKIISMFFILLLVSGCDKANTLKPVQPVKNQIIKSDDNHSVKLNDNLTGQSNNSKLGRPNNSQNTKINEQKHHLGSTVACTVFGLVITASIGLSIYVAAFCHYPVILFRRLVLPGISSYTIEDIMLGRLISSDVNLLTPKELSCLKNPYLDERLYSFLWNTYRTRCSHSADLVRPLEGNSYTDVLIMLDEFNKEIVYRRECLENEKNNINVSHTIAGLRLR